MNFSDMVYMLGIFETCISISFAFYRERDKNSKARDCLVTFFNYISADTFRKNTYTHTYPYSENTGVFRNH